MAQRVWMITGASRGFGAEISKAVLAAGDKLVATARTMEGLQHLGANSNLFTIALDVTDEPQAREAVSAALAHFGHVDVLVNNAGICLLGAVEESSGDEVERLYRYQRVRSPQRHSGVVARHAAAPFWTHHQHLVRCRL